jgi:hypothetical protein
MSQSSEDDLLIMASSPSQDEKSHNPTQHSSQEQDQQHQTNNDIDDENEFYYSDLPDSNDAQTALLTGATVNYSAFDDDNNMKNVDGVDHQNNNDDAAASNINNNTTFKNGNTRLTVNEIMKRRGFKVVVDAQNNFSLEEYKQLYDAGKIEFSNMQMAFRIGQAERNFFRLLLDIHRRIGHRLAHGRMPLVALYDKFNLLGTEFTRILGKMQKRSLVHTAGSFLKKSPETTTAFICFTPRGLSTALAGTLEENVNREEYHPQVFYKSVDELFADQNFFNKLIGPGGKNLIENKDLNSNSNKAPATAEVVMPVVLDESDKRLIQLLKKFIHTESPDDQRITYSRLLQLLTEMLAKANAPPPKKVQFNVALHKYEKAGEFSVIGHIGDDNCIIRVGRRQRVQEEDGTVAKPQHNTQLLREGKMLPHPHQSNNAFLWRDEELYNRIYKADPAQNPLRYYVVFDIDFVLPHIKFTSDKPFDHLAIGEWTLLRRDVEDYIILPNTNPHEHPPLPKPEFLCLPVAIKGCYLPAGVSSEFPKGIVIDIESAKQDKIRFWQRIETPPFPDSNDKYTILRKADKMEIKEQMDFQQILNKTVTAEANSIASHTHIPAETVRVTFQFDLRRIYVIYQRHNKVAALKRANVIGEKLAELAAVGSFFTNLRESLEIRGLNTPEDWAREVRWFMVDIEPAMDKLNPDLGCRTPYTCSKNITKQKHVTDVQPVAATSTAQSTVANSVIPTNGDLPRPRTLVNNTIRGSRDLLPLLTKPSERIFALVRIAIFHFETHFYDKYDFELDEFVIVDHGARNGVEFGRVVAIGIEDLETKKIIRFIQNGNRVPEPVLYRTEYHQFQSLTILRRANAQEITKYLEEMPVKERPMHDAVAACLKEFCELNKLPLRIYTLDSVHRQIDNRVVYVYLNCPTLSFERGPRVHDTLSRWLYAKFKCLIVYVDLTHRRPPLVFEQGVPVEMFLGQPSEFNYGDHQLSTTLDAAAAKIAPVTPDPFVAYAAGLTNNNVIKNPVVDAAPLHNDIYDDITTRFNEVIDSAGLDDAFFCCEILPTTAASHQSRPKKVSGFAPTPIAFPPPMFFKKDAQGNITQAINRWKTQKPEMMFMLMRAPPPIGFEKP